MNWNANLFEGQINDISKYCTFWVMGILFSTMRPYILLWYEAAIHFNKEGG